MLFIKKKLEGIDIDTIKTQEDFERLPFTWKGDLRDAYPLGLQAVPDEEIVRIHSSSGTTGLPVIIPYTSKDVEDWAIMFQRCLRNGGNQQTRPYSDHAGIRPVDGRHPAFRPEPNALARWRSPRGRGTRKKQLQMMRDLKSTVPLRYFRHTRCSWRRKSPKRGIRDQIHLKKGVIGSERWGEKMRKRIADELGIRLYDIYGLTEVYGPGIGISCDYECGMHLWDDYLYFEIVHPKTGEIVPDGEVGELVITTLKKEGAPLIRYRTHDLTRFIPGDCPLRQQLSTDRYDLR